MTPSDHIETWQRVQHEKRRKPATIIPARRNEHGRWIPAKSSCCRRRIVFFDGEQYDYWLGFEGDQIPDAELRCERCNKELQKPIS